MAETKAKPKNLAQRILAIMNDVEHLQKDDTIKLTQGSYKGISEEKVITSTRKAMIEHGVIMVPSTQNREQVGKITYMDIIFTLINVDNMEETLEIPSSGYGWDTQDKGPGKAMTYAGKYAILKAFLIPTGEDPDKISSDQIDKQEADLLKRSEKEAEDLRQKQMGEIMDALAHIDEITDLQELGGWFRGLPDHIKHDPDVKKHTTIRKAKLTSS